MTTEPLATPKRPGTVRGRFGDWALVRNGAVFLQGTEGAVFDDCTFDRLDGTGVGDLDRRVVDDFAASAHCAAEPAPATARTRSGCRSSTRTSSRRRSTSASASTFLALSSTMSQSPSDVTILCDHKSRPPRLQIRN